MSRRIASLTAFLACLLTLEPVMAAESLRIGWGDLLPAGAPVPAQQKISATPSTAGGAVALATSLEGEAVELSGYLLPADIEDGLVYAFMLVPRSGACSHMTQPPPSQVVRVVPEEPYELSMNYESVSVTGELALGFEKTQLFILDGVAVIESGYNIRMAKVERTEMQVNTGAEHARSPWSFLPHTAE